MGIFNADGGTLRTMDMEAFCAQACATFERHGHTLDCKIVAGRTVERHLRSAATRKGVDAVLVGGGDGTISTAAAIAFQTGTPVAVLPAGTMNLFARALQVPLELEDALEALAAGKVGAVDVATANGRPFVHQFGVGIHARLVRIREGMVYRSRLGKMLASLRAIAATALRPPVFDAELRTAAGIETIRVSGIAISNNRVGDGHIPYADRLDAGVLGVYVAAPVSTAELIGLAAGVLKGNWRSSPFVSETEVSSVTLRFPKRKRGAKAVIDGELVRLERSIELTIHPLALPVILPGVDREADTGLSGTNQA